MPFTNIQLLRRATFERSKPTAEPVNISEQTQSRVARNRKPITGKISALASKQLEHWFAGTSFEQTDVIFCLCSDEFTTERGLLPEPPRAVNMIIIT